MCRYLAFLAEQGEYQAGLDFFTHLDLDGINDPIDRAWLSVHGARCLLERGQKIKSFEAALDASAIGAFYTDDATALTISAAAFTCAFSAADLESKRFEPMMRANDVAPLWWRHQQRAWACQRSSIRSLKSGPAKSPQDIRRKPSRGNIFVPLFSPVERPVTIRPGDQPPHSWRASS